MTSLSLEPSSILPPVPASRFASRGYALGLEPGKFGAHDGHDVDVGEFDSVDEEVLLVGFGVNGKCYSY
jgi:hypothetical protein